MAIEYGEGQGAQVKEGAIILSLYRHWAGQVGMLRGSHGQGRCRDRFPDEQPLQLRHVPSREAVQELPLSQE